jgi:hypothetical protein
MFTSQTTEAKALLVLCSILAPGPFSGPTFQMLSGEYRLHLLHYRGPQYSPAGQRAQWVDAAPCILALAFI